MTKQFLSFTFLLLSLAVSAQTLEERFRSFQHQSQQDYEAFREGANQRYADFLSAAWEYYYAAPVVKRPEDQHRPPVVYDNDDKREDDKPIPFEDIITPPEQDTVPVNVPINDNAGPHSKLQIEFYGTAVELVYAPVLSDFSVPDAPDGSVLADAWTLLSDGRCEKLLNSCLAARSQLRLCDYAYLMLLRQLSAKMVHGGNSATLLCAYLYARSGYAMRLANTENGKLVMLFGSDYQIYDWKCYQLDDMYFYPVSAIVSGDNTTGSVRADFERLYISQAHYDGESVMNLAMTCDNLFDEKLSRTNRNDGNGIAMECAVNLNKICFYNDYPTGQVGGDAGTRWQVYANAPLERSVQLSLYPPLREAVKGCTERRAVQKLLTWVQKAFTYEYDDKVWGEDRAFFPAETLHYPYSDCEDRSILLSRIVRDILHLDVVLLLYPNHLATAVRFNENVSGDYVLVDGAKYVVCDPTYIGAPVGLAMPDLDTEHMKIIKLQR